MRSFGIVTPRLGEKAVFWTFLKRKKVMGTFVSAFMALFLGLSFSAPAMAADKPIVISSKVDTEGALLGNMIALVLEKGGLKVEEHLSLGASALVRQAILNGQIDIYPEYTGNGAFFFQMEDNPVWEKAQQGYEMVRNKDLALNKIVWLTPAPANNTWGIAVRQDLATKEHLKTLADFARYVNDKKLTKLAASAEFVSSAQALPAFEKAYGFHLSGKQLLTFSGGNTAATIKAAAIGTDGVNFGMAYATDGALKALGLVMLEDPKSVQPVYLPAAIVRASVLDKYPQIKTLLAPVFKSLTKEVLQDLNAKSSLGGIPAQKVARDYLKNKGFI